MDCRRCITGSIVMICWRKRLIGCDLESGKFTMDGRVNVRKPYDGWGVAAYGVISDGLDRTRYDLMRQK